MKVKSSTSALILTIAILWGVALTSYAAKSRDELSKKIPVMENPGTSCSSGSGGPTE